MPGTVEAERMQRIPFSGIRKVFEEVSRLEKQGKKVINLCIGRPDFDTPEHIKAAAKKALDDGLVHYTSNYGLDALREAIAEKLERENGVRGVGPSNVIVTAGANDAVFIAMMAFLDPGDEVIIPNPAWLHYYYCAELAGARPVSVPLRPENGYVVDPDEVERLVTPRTKMLVVNTPQNPTGAVFGAEVLERLAEIARKHDLLVLSDEIYEKLIYDGLQHVSMASLPGMWERTITVNGFSKAYSMTGWRLGYVVGPEQFVSAMIRVHQYTVTCATSFAQQGGVAALRGSQECVERMRQEFDRRRQVLIEAFCDGGQGLSMVRPRGAFYGMLDIRRTGMSSEEAARFFLREAGVAMVPGSAFGEYGEGYLRVAYSNSYENVLQATRLIKHAVRLLGLS